ncbi:hypothetical protein JCM8208_000024 [Rhodotorula glutinis]
MAAVAAPVDPGQSIQWAKHPEYLARLVDQLALVPTRDNTHHLVWTSIVRKSQDFKNRRELVLDQVTAALFDSGGDTNRAKKQRDSVLRKIQAIAKDYSNALLTLKADPYAESTNLAIIRNQQPHFDTLHAILRGHPDFDQWEEGQAVLPADDDPMQDVQHAAAAAAAPPPPPPAGPAHPAATPRAAALQRLAQHLPPPTPAPAPAPAAAPAHSPHHAPVAGPAYPNPHLAHLYGAQPQPGQPQQGDAQGDEPSPRALAAQAALKRARRDPSPEDATPVAQRRAPARVLGAVIGAGWDRGFEDLTPPAAAPPAPAPAPAPVVVAAPQSPPPPAPLHDDHALSRCPKCDLAFVSADPTAVEVHLRACLDAGGATVCECPVCGQGLGDMGEEEQARHVGECCEGAMSGGGGGAREHVVFVSDDKTTPRDDKTLEPLECIMCLDDFAPGERLARLSCYCVFHEPCIVEFWQQPGKFCPTHRERDGPTEVVMRGT